VPSSKRDGDACFFEEALLKQKGFPYASDNLFPTTHVQSHRADGPPSICQTFQNNQISGSPPGCAVSLWVAFGECLRGAGERRCVKEGFDSWG